MTPVGVGNMPGLVYQSAELADPLMSGMPLAIAALSKAETRLSEDTMMAATPSEANCCPAAWAVAGSPLSSRTMTWTGCPSMPPLALTQAAQAGATVAPWSLEEACAPVSEPITPILISAPFGAAADVPLVVAPDDEELLPLLHAATPSAAARTPASSAVRVNADRLVSFAAADVRSQAVRCVLLITGFVPP